jgi:hypothetical protein
MLARRRWAEDRQEAMIRALIVAPRLPDELWRMVWGEEWTWPQWRDDPEKRPKWRGQLTATVWQANQKLARQGLRIATGGRGGPKRPKPYRILPIKEKRPTSLKMAYRAFQPEREEVVT